ncbi:ankyrin repeat-containing domain, PGG domain protein [Artemisia annua]|uniref:Ankyrin repeat-containing domain, PGG domain protein n=1 Tax=Artemisia annua TaxID=35608 RepID=A0A2U1KLI1_ARTAN|nr:ankyrin repeat-containing domain, PGG domain protein [Artemisia annua]
MNKEDLTLENKNHNTALYLAAAAGNIKTVEIMLAKNQTLHTIPGAKGAMMPLYAAVIFGNKDVVKHLYKLSKDLCDDGWNRQNRSWLLEKCVESDMFDIAIKIVQKYPELGRSNTLLGLLARKPEAFSEKKSNMIGRSIKLGNYIYSSMFNTHQPSEIQQSEPQSGSVPKNSAQPVASPKSEPHSGTVPKDSASPNTKSNIIGRAFKSVSAFFVGEPDNETEALRFLRIIWEDILTLSKDEIDRILRGPPDTMKPAKGWVFQAMKLKELISEQLEDMEKQLEEMKNKYPKERQVPKLKRLVSQYVLKMHTETQNIITEENKTRSSKGDQALELERIISENIVKLHDDTQELIKQGAGVKSLHGLISNHITFMRKEATSLKKTYSNRVVFVAANKGNTKFLVELIRGYPDLIWKVNDNNLSIFHSAVKHRQEDIYNLLYEIGAMKDMITPLKDKNDNNMLHLVGKIAKQKRLADVSGVALQMQRELLWFEEVKKMIPPSYRNRKNKDDLTPHDLFTQEHKELVTQGEKWMKGTANQCMVVAALIATIVFAAAFTVPGGYDQNDGIPMFYSKATFLVFVVADAISLFASSASILIFLSILTSRYAERDFLESIPNKLMAGLATLFISIATMTLAFGVSFFVLYKNGFLWIPILISVFALLPVILYLFLQYGLFADVIRSTYRSRYLFKPKKHVLYYENPKV